MIKRAILQGTKESLNWWTSFEEKNKASLENYDPFPDSGLETGICIRCPEIKQNGSLREGLIFIYPFETNNPVYIGEIRIPDYATNICLKRPRDNWNSLESLGVPMDHTPAELTGVKLYRNADIEQLKDRIESAKNHPLEKIAVEFKLDGINFVIARNQMGFNY